MPSMRSQRSLAGTERHCDHWCDQHSRNDTNHPGWKDPYPAGRKVNPKTTTVVRAMGQRGSISKDSDTVIPSYPKFASRSNHAWSSNAAVTLSKLAGLEEIGVGRWRCEVLANDLAVVVNAATPG